MASAHDSVKEAANNLFIVPREKLERFTAGLFSIQKVDVMYTSTNSNTYGSMSQRYVK